MRDHIFKHSGQRTSSAITVTEHKECFVGGFDVLTTAKQLGVPDRRKYAPCGLSNPCLHHPQLLVRCRCLEGPIRTTPKT